MTAAITVQNIPSAPLAMVLFGPMQVFVNGRKMLPPHSRKALWLLALLTLRHDRPVERAWLAGILWPDMNQEQAFANLRRILSELRASLENQSRYLQSPNRHTLFLDLTDADVDVVAFDAAMVSQIPASLKQAVALYRGPLLEGCVEEWVGQERTAREQNCLKTLQKLADSAVAAGDYPTAIGYYKRAVDLAPWWDTVQRGLMEALTASGDTNAALQVYREFAELLKNDPKAIPDQQTSALYARLRAEARLHSEGSFRAAAHTVVAGPAAPPVEMRAVAGYLPQPLTNLVGREDERQEVAVRLRRSRLVTLTGLGGIGKTRLAIAVAQEIVQEYQDGAWLVPLESLNEGHLIVHQVASVLGLKEEVGRPLLSSVSDYLRPRRLLLVLDNCEHLIEASAHLVSHLLQECAGIRILATSRETLGINGETAWAVPSMAVPNPMHLPQGHTTLQRVLMSYESIQLFVERAQAAQPTFQLTKRNALTVTAICCRLEGIPLAIELAAAQVKAMTVGQIASQLNEHLGLLLAGSRMSLPRQQTLQATLDWSYELLSAPERTLLQSLSVFTGGWTLEAAEQVCSGVSGEINEVSELLFALIDKSLVVFEASDLECSGRYHLLEIVRQYAVAKLQASGESEPLKARHREWLVGLAEEAERQLKGAEQAIWLVRLEVERDNLRTTLEWEGGGQEGVESSLRLVGAFGQYWYVRGHYHEGRMYLERALARDKARLKTTVRAKALKWAGSLGCRQGEFHAAQALLEESLMIHRALGDRQAIANSLNNLGVAAQALGDFPAAQALFEESLLIRRELGDRYGLAVALGNLGNMAQARHNYVAARSHYEESLRIHTELGDKYGIAWSLHSLGNAALDQEDYVSAEALHRKSLALFDEIEDRRGIAWSHYKLGSVARVRADYADAQALYEESLRLFTEIGERHGAAWSVYGLGYTAHLSGCPGLAQTLYNQALERFLQIGDLLGRAFSAQKLGDVAYEQGDMVQARTRHANSLDLFRELGDKEGVIDSLIGFAAVVQREGDHEKAICLLGAANTLWETAGSSLKPIIQERFEQQSRQARTMLGEEAFAVAWKTGQALTQEQAIEHALDITPH